MHTAALLFYGTNTCPVQPPTLAEINPATNDEQLVRECLAHMTRRAGGHFSSMREPFISVNRHPDGAVVVSGNGWSVSFESDSFRAARDVAISAQTILPFISRWVSVRVTL